MDVSASVGVVEVSGDSHLSLSQLMAQADARMYADKQSRRQLA